MGLFSLNGMQYDIHISYTCIFIFIPLNENKSRIYRENLNILYYVTCDTVYIIVCNLILHGKNITAHDLQHNQVLSEIFLN